MVFNFNKIQGIFFLSHASEVYTQNVPLLFRSLYLYIGYLGHLLGLGAYIFIAGLCLFVVETVKALNMNDFTSTEDLFLLYLHGTQIHSCKGAV